MMPEILEGRRIKPQRFQEDMDQGLRFSGMEAATFSSKPLLVGGMSFPIRMSEPGSS
jgi:hypothetical protein